MDHQNDHDHDQQQFTGLLRPLSASLLAPDAFSFNWCPQSQDWISATKTTADNKEIGINNGYAIFQEDVISVIRSCIDPSRFLITHFPLLNDKRTRQCVQLALSDSNSTTIDVPDQFESALRTWLRNPQELPHRPLPEHSRRLLVLLNPFSGQRKALQLWRQEVEPVWREAGFQIELAVTERAGHATEMMATVDLDRVGMLALGGGDGLVSEALHGLLSRPDQERALRLPILHLPMGTGNALASSLAFQANEPFAARGCFCLQMALMAVRPVFRRLRLYNVEFSGGQRRTMFLSLSWGLMADIDIGSERFRFLGQARLHLEAFLRVAFLPSMARYRARISYLPVPEGPELTELMTKLRAKKRSLLGQEHFKGGEFGDGEEEQQQAEEQEVEMPSLSECVPSSWKTLQGEFCFVHLAALSHLGSDLPYLPSARLHDRCMFLTFVQWPRLHSRVHMARILLSIDTSDHLDDSVMEIIPVLACRVEPEPGAGGWLALDGEAVDQSMLGKAGAFQASVSNQCATVIGRRLARRSTEQ